MPDMNWGILLSILLGTLAIVIVRPWRFWWSRRRCPQCQGLLPRWDLWGWKEDWTCRHCGCQVLR